MKRPFLVLLVVGQCLLVSSVSDGHSEGVTYYVKPSESRTECPGQPCETFQYYLDNINTTLNKERNITMIFLDGHHSCLRVPDDADSVIVTTPVIKMIGEYKNTSLCCGFSFMFVNNTKVVFKSLKLIGLGIELQCTSKHREYQMSLIVLELLYCTIMTDTICPRLQLFVENSLSESSGWFLMTHSDFEFSNCTFHNVPIFEVDSIDVGVRVRDCSFMNTPVSTHSNIIISGYTSFMDSSDTNSALTAYRGNVTLSGTISFVNNSAVKGGAITLLSSTLNIDANTIVTFINNSAKQWGGAIYVAPGIIPGMVILDYEGINPPCFYYLLNCNASSTYDFVFENNSASFGGDDIYGVSLIHSDCSFDSHCNLTITRSSSSNSSISSDPLRVCLCDNDGKPQCANDSYNFMHYSVHPGEMFMLSLTVVGGDFGLTVGTVYASIYHQYSEHCNSYTVTPPSISPSIGQSIQDISSCTKIDYSLYSKNNTLVCVFLTTTLLIDPNLDDQLQPPYTPDGPGCSNGLSAAECLLLPVFIELTILPCPPGFKLLDADQAPRCDCYPKVTETLNVTCHITNKTGYFLWIGNLWINIKEDEKLIIYDDYCPHNYCKEGSKIIDLSKNSSSQCNFNRAGRLCGQCKDSYSLAIGSSNCIHCQTNNNFALTIFFALAGLMLVFFIGVRNVTVTEGKINGLIFYANIVWTYKDIFFMQVRSKNAVMIFLKTFIAWLNLDFGIETCFVKGLTAFWKMWLQYIFPFYIWIIAGLIIVATRYSMRLTNLLGNRAVPLLATLFLLSYMKLLRVAVSSLEFSVLSRIDYAHDSESPSIVVWSVDGSLGYFEFPHILVFLAGLITLLFLWMPYTLLLFLMQWLRRLPQHGILKWIMRFHPLYDAYFAPLKPKHHYWFGALLFARGVLLVIFASSFAIPQDINLLLLLILAVFLVYYMVLTHPYKNRGTLILQSSYLVNLILLSGFFFFAYRQPKGPLLQSIAIGFSTGFAFFQFCAIVIHAVIVPVCCKGQKPRP